MKQQTLFGIGLMVLLLISACGASEGDALATENALRTQAVNTVYAEFTQAALLNPSATFTTLPTNTPSATNTPAAAPSATSAPVSGSTGAFPTSDTCDFMAFIADVTIPDGTKMTAGQSFTKTWRLQNNGSCTWSTSYTVAYDSGTQMAGPDSQALSTAVAPGETVDISVNLNAPASAGTYIGYWVLRNAAGFDVGSFYVEIEVD